MNRYLDKEYGVTIASVRVTWRYKIGMAISLNCTETRRRVARELDFWSSSKMISRIFVGSVACALNVGFLGQITRSHKSERWMSACGIGCGLLAMTVGMICSAEGIICSAEGSEL